MPECINDRQLLKQGTLIFIVVVFILCILYPAVYRAQAASGQSSKPTAKKVIIAGKAYCSLTRVVILPFEKSQIQIVRARVGQAVKAGTVLVQYRLDPGQYLKILQKVRRPLDAISDLELKILEITNKLTILKIKYQGMLSLSRSNLESKQNIELIEQQIKIMTMTQRLLRTRKARQQFIAKEIRGMVQSTLGVNFKTDQVPREGLLQAPINGHVIWMHPELRKGAVMPVVPALRVGVMHPMLVKAVVHEVDAQKIAVGSRARIVIESLAGHEFTAQVKSIDWSPTVLSLERPSYYTVELVVPNPQLRIKEGMNCKIIFNPGG